MSASKNAGAMTPAQGEFHSRVPPSEPLIHKGHAPGIHVGNDRVPEFHAETFPPGTAPAKDTFLPRLDTEAPVDEPGATRTAASQTLGGATSADVHRGLGLPGGGVTSQEAHGGKGKRESAGLEGVGANPADPIHQRAFDRQHDLGRREKSGDPAAVPGAQKTTPVGAEELARERPGGASV